MAAPNQLRQINDDHSTEHNNMEHEMEAQSTLSFKSNHKNRRHPLHHLYWPLSWIIFMVSLSSVSSEMIYRVDPLGKYLLQYLNFLRL